MANVFADAHAREKLFPHAVAMPASLASVTVNNRCVREETETPAREAGVPLPAWVNC